MKEKDFYIMRISEILRQLDVDTVNAFYLTVCKIEEGRRTTHGLQKRNHKVNQ